MKKTKNKIVLFTTLLVIMITYIGWVFYISEPKYIDNCYKKVEKFDYVSIPKSQYWDLKTGNVDVENGIVLQIDSTKAIVKLVRWSTEFIEMDLKQHNFRIIGKGTIYHKVNNYVGINVMSITQIFIGILSAILIIILVTILIDIIYK